MSFIFIGSRYEDIPLFGLWKNMMGALPNKSLDFSDTVVSRVCFRFAGVLTRTR